MEHLAVGISHTRFAPCADEPEEGAILYPQPEHLQQPFMINVVEEAFDVRFSHRVVRATLPMTGESSHRISCANLLPGAVATRQEV